MVPRTQPHLRRGEIVAGSSSILLLIVLFTLHWLSSGHHAGQTGFSAFSVLRFFLLISGVLGLLLTVTQVTTRAPAIPAVLDMVTVTFGALTTLLLVIRLLFGSGDVQAGAIGGLLTCAGVTAGAFMALRAEDGWIPGPDHPVETVRVHGAPGV